MSSRSSLTVKNLDSASTRTTNKRVAKKAIIRKKPTTLKVQKAASIPKTKSTHSKTKKPTVEVTTTKAVPQDASPSKTKKATTKKPAAKTKTPKKPATKTGTAKKVAIKKTKPATKTPSRTNLTIKKDRLLSHNKRHPLGHLLLEKKLREAGFAGGISTNKNFLDQYSTDESIFSIRPQIVLQPKSLADITMAVTIMATETEKFSSLSLTPRGAGTGYSGGSLTDSVVVDISAHLTTIGEVEYHKKEVHLTCDAGTPWHQVEKRLARIGYHIPVILTSRDYCTVGGAVSNNAAGADSTTYNRVSDWVEKLDVVLHDGSTATVTPLTYKQFVALTKEKSTYATLVQNLLGLLEKQEVAIKKAKPRKTKPTAGYPLWDIVPQGIKAFKKGTGTLDLISLFAGSQGTLGIITSVTLRAIEKPRHNHLIVVPIFNLVDAHKVIEKAIKYEPLNMEVFDNTTFDLALKHPDFFRKYNDGMSYYRSVLSMYTLYHVRYSRKTPELTLLITIPDTHTKTTTSREIAKAISTSSANARVVATPHEEAMFNNIRRASYTLLKLEGLGKRPAPCLEDMKIPCKEIPQFLTKAKKLFKEFNVPVVVSGHAGVGHFHFYPLIDFTQKTAPTLIEKLSTQYYDIAKKHGGEICSEQNDGILRTSKIETIFGKSMTAIFNDVESLFDPLDIFNPGKKVSPRFDIQSSIRTKN